MRKSMISLIALAAIGLAGSMFAYPANAQVCSPSGSCDAEVVGPVVNGKLKGTAEISYIPFSDYTSGSPVIATEAYVTAATTGTAGGDLSGTYPNPTVAKASNGLAVTGNVTTTGGVVASGAFSSAGSLSSPDTSMTRTIQGKSQLVAIDPSRTANNRMGAVQWSGGVLGIGFYNDTMGTFNSAIAITGGQAAGVTKIASAGPWTHSGQALFTSSNSGGGSASNLIIQNTGAQFSSTLAFNNTVAPANAKFADFNLGIDGTLSYRLVADNNQTSMTWFSLARSGISPTIMITSVPTWNHTGTFSAGGGLRVKEGTNAKQGIATLVAGTVTVANTSVTANSRIFLTGQDDNVKGASRVSTRVAGTSFTITSSEATDTGVVAYEIFEPGT